MSQIDLLGAPDVGGPRDELDRYFTPPWCTRALMHYLGDRLRSPVWEPCAGHGWIVDELRRADHTVLSSDICEHESVAIVMDFLTMRTYCPRCSGSGVYHRFAQDAYGPPAFHPTVCDCRMGRATPPRWIVTNPPYRTVGDRTAATFVRHALSLGVPGVAMLLRLSWLEPVEDRWDILTTDPPTDLLVLPRVSFIGAPKGGESITSAWFIWDRNRIGQSIKVYPFDIREPTFDWGRL